ncbi:hypothetical protein MKW98_006334 [Papaver atlanticum]|uniref:Pectinesterase inhibitor domain-containing protein n=1 Tax=Papaver atlanticum TaxID=357466 RepID=A0AAD4XWY0_9MAGN|nr:hypothetical protein MKW98_006334 [Papaver atlanticum]
MSQSFFPFLPIFIVLLVLNSFHGVYGDLINDVCKEASKQPDLSTYDFCVASFSSNPANGKEKPAAMTMYLKECLDLYSIAVDDVQDAISNFKVQAYDGANTCMGSAQDNAGTCEDGFTEGPQKLVSPLTKQNDDFIGLAHISLVITNMV